VERGGQAERGEGRVDTEEEGKEEGDEVGGEGGRSREAGGGAIGWEWGGEARGSLERILLVVLELLVIDTPRNYPTIQSVFSYELVQFKMRWMSRFGRHARQTPWTYVADSTEFVTEVERSILICVKRPILSLQFLLLHFQSAKPKLPPTQTASTDGKTSTVTMSFCRATGVEPHDALRNCHYCLRPMR